MLGCAGVKPVGTRRIGEGDSPAGQGQDISTAASQERLRRATDSRPSELQSIEDAFAEHLCAVIRGPLLVPIPGTLLVSESQVLFHAPSIIAGGKDLVLELPLRHVTTVEPTRVHLGTPAIRIRRGRESHVFANFGLLGGKGPRVVDRLSAPLRGWGGSGRDAVLEKIRGLWDPQGAIDDPAKGPAPTWPCACCLPLKAVEGVNSDLTDGSPLAHMMISLELPCSTKRARRLLFSDQSSFEVQAKELVGGTDVRVTPWRSEANGASTREVRWQQSLRALPRPLIDQLGIPQAASAVVQTRCCEPRPGTFVSVGNVRVDVPFGDSFMSRSKWVLRPASQAPVEGRSPGSLGLPGSPGSPGKGAACELIVSYEVVFLKHVMLAPVIESTNLREARRNFTALVPLIKETVSTPRGNWPSFAASSA